MPDEPSSGVLQQISLLTDRVTQMLELLKEERLAARAERDLLHQSSETLLRYLEGIGEHTQMSERHLAAASRLEGNLREGLADAHRLVDKLPGRRMQ